LRNVLKFRVIDFLEKKSFFSKSQFGFRSGLSTNDALYKVDNFVRSNLDKSNKVMDIFLNVQKAFDCVVHELLLKKLENSGIRGVSNNLSLIITDKKKFLIVLKSKIFVFLI